MKFIAALKIEILKNIFNDFEDNIDEVRFKKEEFGKFKKNKFFRILSDFLKIKNYLEKTYKYKHYSYLYKKLSDSHSRNCLLKVAAYKIMLYRKVKLPIVSKYYKSLDYLKSIIKTENEYLDHSFTFLPKFELFDLKPINFNVKLFNLYPGIAIIFVLEQYRNNYLNIRAKKGDYILDLGGFYGDTALYFAEIIGNEGKVFCFEFIPNNLKAFDKHIELNPHLKNIIEIVKKPVGEKTDEKLFYWDNGPGSSVSRNKRNDDDIEITSITIDDFVSKQNIKKIDFIKMDIEGSELAALKGARKVIEKFKPNLAISIYHKNEDPYEIPKFIDSLNLGYKFSVDQFYIFPEEVMLYAAAN